MRKAVGFCMISALAACMDGFQTKIPGSIIANRGFINQFGALLNPVIMPCFAHCQVL
jgi:hypothetical protein